MPVFNDLIEEVIKNTDGNLIEIGGGHGENTVLFAEIADKYNRKVLVIDPFESGWDNMPSGYRGYTYKGFLKTVHKFKDRIYVFFHPSQDEECYTAIESIRPISFAYVDGLQYKSAVISDLNMMAHFNVPLIVVDDMDRQTDISQVPIAIYEFLTYSKYELIETKDKRRAYLKLKDDKSNNPKQ